MSSSRLAHPRLLCPFFTEKVKRSLLISIKSQSLSKGINRPFAAEVLAQAGKVSADYQVILACEDGEWYGRGLEMPHVFADGKTPTQCVTNTRAALATAVATLLGRGDKPRSGAIEAADDASKRASNGRREIAFGSDRPAEGIQRAVRIHPRRGNGIDTVGRPPKDAAGCTLAIESRILPRRASERGAGGSRTHDGGFAIRCLSLLATAPNQR